MSNKKVDVKIGTPIEALWNNVKKESEMLIKQSENNLIIQRAMLKMALRKIEEEKVK